MRKLATGILGATLFLTGGAISYAGTTWKSESLILPGFNNSEYSNTQVKVTSGAQTGLQLNATGSTTPDVRTSGEQGDAAWVRDVKGGSTYALPSLTNSGKTERLQFSSELLETSKVTVSFNWRSN